MTGPSLPLRRFVAAVSVLGTAVLGAVLSWGAGEHEGGWPPAVGVALGLLVVLGHLWSIRVPRRAGDEHITTSLAFALATLLLFGAPPALAAVAAASLVHDLLHRKPLWKIGFNVGQIALGLVAAATALDRLGYEPRGTRVDFEPGHLVALAGAGLAWFLVNSVLVGVVVGLSGEQSALRAVWASMRAHAPRTAVQVASAPVVASIVGHEPIITPLLIVPVLALHRVAGALAIKEHQAMHDGLTGLPNRLEFRLRVEDLLHQRDEAGTLAVLLVDLDRFKEINDTLGHHTGDQLLAQVGPRLEEALREGDVVARLGGDEFAVVLPGLGDARTAVEVGRRLLHSIERPYVLSGMELRLGGSVGIALAPLHGDDVDTLLQRADVAMYLAKEHRSGCEVYREDRDRYSPQRLVLTNQLKPAIEGDQLLLHFQPKADLQTGAVTGVEALVRWRHPERGMVPPDQFISLAEHTGLIEPLTRWVLDAAVRQAREWRRAGIAVPVAVNLSVRNLHDPGFPAALEATLLEHGAHPSWLQLEITESSLMADPSSVLAVLQVLRDIGVELALDDFGTGYSSLSYLKRMRVDELKVDRSFVTGLVGDDSDRVIVTATLELARNLGLRTVAEGVETQDVWDELRELGCDQAQGFLLSRPLPADEATAWLVDRMAPDPTPGTIVLP